MSSIRSVRVCFAWPGSVLLLLLLVPLAAFAADAGSQAVSATAAEQFFKGRTVRLVVGFAPGGGYDVASRVVAKHLGKFLPGNPTILVENRPGAGGLIAVNQAFNTLPADGTYIMSVNPLLLQQQVIGHEGVKFDGRAFKWLGSLSSSDGACAVHRDSGVTNIEQIRGAKGRIINMGGNAPGAGPTDTAAVMRAALGLKFRIIYGYPGQAPIAAAIERRELDGFCTGWESFTSTLANFFEPERLMNILVIAGDTVPDHPWLKGAVAAEAAAPDAQARKALRMSNAPRRIAHPYAVRPDVPADRFAVLRRGFDKMLSDRAFAADYERLGREYTPRSGDEVNKIVSELFAADPQTVGFLKKALEQREDP